MKLIVATLLILVGADFCMAIAVAYSKHLSRGYNMEISQLRSNIDDLGVEWGRLQIEEGALSEHSRIEFLATDRLGMKVPEFESIKLLVAQ